MVPKRRSVEFNPGSNIILSEENSKKQWLFLMKQLIQRDFKSRYKRAFLGILWSMISPLFQFLAQVIVFSFLFSRGEHYVSYLITGNIVYHYFTDATSHGMHALSGNSGIISNIKVKNDYFIISKNISCFLNFLLTWIILCIILIIDKIPFHLNFLLLIYPTVCLFFFNLGVGYILSTLQTFFKDTEYFYRMFTSVLIYFSAIFYRTDRFPEKYRLLFYYNPVYSYISWFRAIIIENRIPNLWESMFCLAYAAAFMCFGWAAYRVNSNRFVYYL